MQKPRGRTSAPLRLPLYLALLLAVILLGVHYLGGEPAFEAMLEKLATSEDFVAGTLALECGPGRTAITVHAPQTAAVSRESPPPEAEPLPVSENAFAFVPRRAAYTEKASTVEVRTTTKLHYNIPAMLAQPYTLTKTQGPQVLIVHTHGSEAYSNDANFSYTSAENYRTTDTAYNVVRVGDRLTEVLESRGIETIHCRTMFDTPAYNGSYARSLTEIEKQLAAHPSIQVVIDLHRDDITLKSGGKMSLDATIDGRDAARLMFVIGTNASGLAHPNWEQNLNWAVNLQAKMDAAHPGLMRAIDLRKQRFNQHLRPASMIIECGASGNTLTEALTSIEAFGNLLASEFGA